MELAGSPGPHVFVDSLTSPVLDDDDRHHLTRSLRMRSGQPLTLSDGRGSWVAAEFVDGGEPAVTGDIVTVPETPRVEVAFSLVKGQKPELVVQKLTELGVDRIVVLGAERSVVRWDAAKTAAHLERWDRIVREAAMQSHRVRLPAIVGVFPAVDHLAQSDVHAAHFGGGPIDASVSRVAIGPEGGWSSNEVEAFDGRIVSLGATVLRAETAAIAACALLCAGR